jgi:hypothetical protein
LNLPTFSDVNTDHTISVTFEQNFEGFESGYGPSWVTRSGWNKHDSIAYNGNYAIQSPPLEDGTSSFVEKTACNELEMDISFWFKVSSEVNYDFLIFKIDGVEKGRWSGEVGWTKASFFVPVGEHRFTWIYQKDENTSKGDDAVWIDDIVFPQVGNCESCDFFVIPNPNGGDAVICL